MKRLSILLVFLGACSTTHDPHAPRTIVAGEAGGEVQVRHGQRLRIELPRVGEHAWQREEPVTPVVIAQGPPEGDVWMFTPVRSGKEKLSFSMPNRTVSYEITVPETTQGLSGWLRSLGRSGSGGAARSK